MIGPLFFPSKAAQAISDFDCFTLCLPRPPFVACISLSSRRIFGCFYELGVLFVGVLVVRTLLIGVNIGAPDFGKLLFK